MSLRVGYVVKRFPRASETFIAQEILELERQGVEVHVFSLRPNDRSVEHSWLDELRAPVSVCNDIQLSIAWKWLHAQAGAEAAESRAAADALRWAFEHPSRRGRHRLCEAVSVAQKAAGLGLDHLHAHFANEPAFVALLAHRLIGIPFSFTGHAKDVYAAGKSPDLATWRRLVGEAAFAVTVTEDNRRYLHGRLGPRLGAKVRRLYNGVDLGTFRPPPPERPTASGRPLEVVTVARLVPKKGLEVAVAALAALRRSGTDLRWRLLGDGPERPALVEAARRHGLLDHIHFAGAVSHREVEAALARADVFVLPSRVTGDGDRDALPTVLLEAMACGVPCVATTVGGIPEIVVHRQTGWLVPPDSPVALAAALGTLASDRALRRSQGAAGRRRAEGLFDRRRNVATLREWLERSAAGRAEPALDAETSGTS